MFRPCFSSASRRKISNSRSPTRSVARLWKLFIAAFPRETFYCNAAGSPVLTDVVQALYCGCRVMKKVTNLVQSDPQVLGGTPVFVGTRVPVQSLFDYLEGGETLDEFLKQFPSVTREHATA